MQLEFLNQLTESQIIDLLNYIYDSPSTHTVQQVQIFAESDRCDKEGNQQILVNAWDNSFHVGMYLIQDFNILEPFNKENKEKKLREYMASIFGAEYLNGLRNYYAIQAEKEIARIQNALGKSRS